MKAKQNLLNAYPAQANPHEIKWNSHIISITLKMKKKMTTTINTYIKN